MGKRARALALADPPGQSGQGRDAAPNDYFHSGAGARYLRRANAVLSVKNGTFQVDPGISKSQDKLRAALAGIAQAPVPFAWNCLR